MAGLVALYTFLLSVLDGYILRSGRAWNSPVGESLAIVAIVQSVISFLVEQPQQGAAKVSKCPPPIANSCSHGELISSTVLEIIGHENVLWPPAPRCVLLRKIFSPDQSSNVLLSL